MARTVLDMSMSLDGFIAGPHESDDFEAAERRLTGVNRQVYDEVMSTGAVVAGRGTFEPAGGWGGDHHDGVPIFVISRHAPGIDIASWPLVTYLDDVELHVVPVLLGGGRRLFADRPPEAIELTRLRVLEGEGGVTHVRYRAA